MGAFFAELKGLGLRDAVFLLQSRIFLFLDRLDSNLCASELVPRDCYRVVTPLIDGSDDAVLVELVSVTLLGEESRHHFLSFASAIEE